MTITISWLIERPTEKHRLPGTSSDWTAFGEVFLSRRTLTRADCDLLDAMHIATRLEESLWSVLAQTLWSLPEGTEITVVAEY